MTTCFDHPRTRAASVLRPVSSRGALPLHRRGLRVAPLLPAPADGGTRPASLFAFPALASLRPQSKCIELTHYFHAPLRTAYKTWTDFGMFPHFMRGVAADRGAEDAGPVLRLRLSDGDVPWEAVAGETIPLKCVAWESTGNRGCHHRGAVQFDAIGRNTTKVRILVEFHGAGTPAVTEDTLRDLRCALDRRMDLLELLLAPWSLLGPDPASL